MKQFMDKDFLLSTPTAVSYTHLDNTLEQYLVITEEDCHCYNLWNQRYTRETLKKEIESAGPVSYTHLDGYKRQGDWRLCHSRHFGIGPDILGSFHRREVRRPCGPG